MRELRESTEDMKIKIETYVAEKRNITAEFRLQEMAHKKYISERREEAKLKRKEEKEAAEAQKMKEWYSFIWFNFFPWKRNDNI